MAGPIEKIHSFSRFGSKLGLERMENLMARLGNPERDLRCIHVAGTNGKGSVCRYLYEMLLKNGYNAGLYISPFLMDFHERMEINSSVISETDLALYTDRVLGEVAAIVEEGGESPTEFEIVKAIAFLYFKEKGADPVILEVGLGGKGDSTNVVERPLVSVIVSISRDHMDRLGETTEEIAGEKAGIIKPGVPVISGVKDIPGAKVIARRAYTLGSVLHDVTAIKPTGVIENLGGSDFDLNVWGTDYSGLSVRMVGAHQIHNAITAVCTVELLRKAGLIKVERTKLYEGLKAAGQPGRFEVMGGNPLIILDGAHNEDGAKVLAETVKAHLEGKKILIVLGLLADKEAGAILSHIIPLASGIIATEPDNPRRLTAARLGAEIVKVQGELGQVQLNENDPPATGSPAPLKIFPLGKEALDYALSLKDEYDVILVAGSLYLIGDIRKHLVE